MGVRYIFGQDGAFRTEPVIVAKNITENGTYDPATEGADGYAPVTVNVEGGGGSSDFSTAEVTINWDTSLEELLRDNCPNILRDNSDENSPYIQGILYLTTSPVVVEVPLYKGKCYWDCPHRDVTVTGNIEELYDGYLITGDCTITIS